MGFLDSISKGIDRALSYVGKESARFFDAAFKSVKEVGRQVADLVEKALDPARVKEALEVVVKAIDTLKLDVPKFFSEVSATIEALTGIKLDLPTLADGLVQMGRLFKDILDGVADIPVEKWLPIAIKVATAVAFFVAGDWVNGTFSLLTAFGDMSSLLNERPDLQQAYPLPESLKSAKVRPEYRNATPKDLHRVREGVEAKLREEAKMRDDAARRRTEEAG